MIARPAVVAKGHADLVQLAPVHVAHDELGAVCQIEYLVQRAVVLVHNEYAVDRAARLYGLLDGIAAHYYVGKLLLAHLGYVLRQGL